jgi:hypothetical protein
MSFLNFQCSAIRIEDDQTDDVFFVYPDRIQQCNELPETLDDAYGNGFLTISLYDSKFATWYLNIANEEYTGSLQKLESILYEWALSENYSWN